MNRNGFTLVEVLAVIVILGLVVGVSMPNVLNSLELGKKTSDTILYKNIGDSLQTMYEEMEYTGGEFVKYDFNGKREESEKVGKVEILDGKKWIIETTVQTLVGNGFLNGVNNPNLPTVCPLDGSVNCNSKVVLDSDGNDLGGCIVSITIVKGENGKVSYNISGVDNGVCPTVSDFDQSVGDEEEIDDDKYVVGVELYKNPTKMTYFPEESINYDGLKLKLIYSDGSNSIIDGASYVTSVSTNDIYNNGIRYIIMLKYPDFDPIKIETYKIGWWGERFGIWYYQLGNGTMASGDSVELPILNYNEIKRKFKFNGNIMYTGWYKTSLGWYYYYEMKKNTIGITDYVEQINAEDLIDKGFHRGARLESVWSRIYSASNADYYWYYFGDDGIAKEGWYKYNNGYYYFRPNTDVCSKGPTCSAVTNITCNINGESYTFDENGLCIKGKDC